jgi:dimethylargininase
MPFTHAIVRPPPATFAAGITRSNEGAPDVALALRQHRAYCEALADCGLQVTTLPADPAYPDSCFVEDPAVVTARGAIAARSSAPSRRGEVESIIAALRGWYPDIARMTAPGTLDGGDICEADGHFLIGLTSRTNEEGARQLAEFLEALGYRSSLIDLRNIRRLLHLKTGMTYLGDGRLLLASDVPTGEALRPYERIVVPEAERYAANCIRINDRVLIAAGHPEVVDTLEGLGYDTLPVELSEFRKMDGSLTCLSLRL